MARRDQDRGQQMYKDAPAPEADWDKGYGPRAGGSATPKRDIIALRAPPAETPPGAERPVETPETDRPAAPAGKTERPAEPAEKEAKPGQQPAAIEEKPTQKPRKSFLRRHPLMAGAGLIALLAAGAATYVYWDSAAHFESTDDAFIAARQFALAPKVAGYVTAVPVTDNQHVNKGDVIARIDQRDYLTALAQAQAQVAGAEAGIHNVDTQIATQDAQISVGPGAGRSGAGEHGARAGHLGTRPAAGQTGVGDGSAGHDRRPELSRPSSPPWIAPKRRSRWRSGRSTR